MPLSLMLYNPPKNADGKLWTPEALAPLVDRFILTPKPEREDYARAMLKVNPFILFDCYILNHGVHWTDGIPNNNQILWYQGEPKAAVKANERLPLRYKDGSMVFKNEKRDYIIVDTAHPFWKQKMIERIGEVRERSPFFRGVWYDDIGVEQRANAVGVIETQQYPTREAYLVNFRQWLLHSREHVALGNMLRFGGNLQAPAKYFKDFQECAGIILLGGGNILIEWGVFDHEGVHSPEAWANWFQKAAFVTGDGDPQGGELGEIIQRDPRKLADKTSRAWREFEFALYSHMLIDNGKCAIRVANDYSLYVDIPEIRGIDQTLGKPLGKYRKNGDVYERDFEKHTIRVNPVTMYHELLPPVQPPEPPQPKLETIHLNAEITVPAAVAPLIREALQTLKITVEDA